MEVKVMIHYKDGVSFGIEVPAMLAVEMVSRWLNKVEGCMEIEGYGFYPNEAIKLELFDLKEDEHN
ncbi:hypothetical protein BH780_gp121 [Bacillus phage Eldridge]|uniref:Uncharacterized protein n=1 Tax=Bacillus phage Eldridge TaxID=1776293 RepID=A0A0Y0AGY8_9CAUD|nr:hypothetical protein BH780_gp121 [Bacillus phage Eldridge]AMB18704.1 hypothetical protein Eldridge_0124 [Bacillus phage Eldridge]